MQRVMIVLLSLVLAVPAVVIGLTVGPIWWLLAHSWRILLPPPVEVRIID